MGCSGFFCNVLAVFCRPFCELAHSFFTRAVLSCDNSHGCWSEGKMRRRTHIVLWHTSRSVCLVLRQCKECTIPQMWACLWTQMVLRGQSSMPLKILPGYPYLRVLIIVCQCSRSGGAVNPAFSEVLCSYKRVVLWLRERNNCKHCRGSLPTLSFCLKWLIG